MTPLTHQTAIANIPATQACSAIPTKHGAFVTSQPTKLESWLDAELERLVERFADFQTVKSVKNSMGR